MTDPLEDAAEVEIVCARCGYRTTRTAARLRRETMIVCPECGAEIVPPGGEQPVSES
jgi:DNA-directed RNA polymerase subunit RPC12/RpoP